VNFLLHTKQVKGLAEAVDELVKEEKSADPDEMVHVTEMVDGSNGLKVELTASDNSRWIGQDGKVYDTKREMLANCP
jgi:predicted RNA-binding protein YlqC (UPF0109 family)